MRYQDILLRPCRLVPHMIRRRFYPSVKVVALSDLFIGKGFVSTARWLANAAGFTM
jgi:hypothetical protein